MRLAWLIAGLQWSLASETTRPDQPRVGQVARPGLTWADEVSQPDQPRADKLSRPGLTWADEVTQLDQPRAAEVALLDQPAGQLAVKCRANQVVHLVLGPRLFTWPHEEEGADHSATTNYRYR
jgi:hypothetical protein